MRCGYALIDGKHPLADKSVLRLKNFRDAIEAMAVLEQYDVGRILKLKILEVYL